MYARFENDFLPFKLLFTHYNINIISLDASNVF